MLEGRQSRTSRRTALAVTLNKLLSLTRIEPFGFVYTISARRAGDLPRGLFEAQRKFALGDNVFEL
jgi:hypothetical protein